MTLWPSFENESRRKKRRNNGARAGADSIHAKKVVTSQTISGKTNFQKENGIKKQAPAPPKPKEETQ